MTKFYKQIKDNQVLCELCPNYCILSKGQISSCNARQNIDGDMISMTYGKIAAINIDPVEKKPLYHFLPGSKTLSIGTAGCNMHCLNCQNHHISQNNPNEIDNKDFMPEEIIELALKNNCKSISYTYNEPTVFYEFVLETAKKAKKAGLKNIIVSNGFINPEPLYELIQYTDAANIDLKAFNPVTYKSLCKADLNAVLESIETLFRFNVYFEITCLLIPGKNDSQKEISEICEWIVHNVTNNVPLHFSRFFPVYKLQDIGPSPLEIIKKACKIAKSKGIKYVYAGNTDKINNNTLCNKCKNIIIQRNAYNAVVKGLLDSECCNCGNLINGVWM